VIYDDFDVPRKTLKEIEAEADRCRALAVLAADGRLNLDQLMAAWGVKLVIERKSKMGGAEAYSLAQTQQIHCIREIARGLRFGDPHSRYLVGHELGHMFLHRGVAPKARKVEGNRTLAFIDKEQSAERQAWMFSRALFVTRHDLGTGESDEQIALRVGISEGPVALRREEVQADIKADQPKVVPQIVARHFEEIRRADREVQEAKKIEIQRDLEMREAWARAAQIQGEKPAKVRSARGYRVEWDHFGLHNSQVGWTVVDGEVRSYMELLSR
jgi:Zn-dependent peptidase ImmA (M78 family)